MIIESLQQLSNNHKQRNNEEVEEKPNFYENPSFESIQTELAYYESKWFWVEDFDNSLKSENQISSESYDQKWTHWFIFQNFKSWESKDEVNNCHELLKDEPPLPDWKMISNSNSRSTKKWKIIDPYKIEYQSEDNQFIAPMLVDHELYEKEFIEFDREQPDWLMEVIQDSPFQIQPELKLTENENKKRRKNIQKYEELAIILGKNIRNLNYDFFFNFEAWVITPVSL